MELSFADWDVLLVTPKQAMIDWANAASPRQHAQLKTSFDHDRYHVYLIPIFEHHTLAWEWLKKNFHEIFRRELMSWWIDETEFPPITWRNFQKFCAFKHHSMVFMATDEHLSGRRDAQEVNQEDLPNQGGEVT